MLPKEGGFAIMLQETWIANRAQEMRVAVALQDKGYIPFFSSRLLETGSKLRRGGLLSAVSSKYVAEHEVLSFTQNCPGQSSSLEICTDNIDRPQAGSSSWTGEAAFWATSRCTPRRAAPAGGTRWLSLATPTSTWLPRSLQPRSNSTLDGRPCGFQRAAGARHGTLAGAGVRPSSSPPGPTRPTLRGEKGGNTRRIQPLRCRLLPYELDAAPVQRCLWTAVTAAQHVSTLAP